jgi:hypothetical protein
MKVGNVVRWSPTNSRPMIGLVLRYCSFQGLWYVSFPEGDYEIEEHYLEVISECG